jgi:hypothetical protein
MLLRVRDARKRVAAHEKKTVRDNSLNKQARQPLQQENNA